MLGNAGESAIGKFVGTEGIFAVTGADNAPATGAAYRGAYSAINWTGVPLWTKFFFELVFAGTARSSSQTPSSEMVNA